MAPSHYRHAATNPNTDSPSPPTPPPTPSPTHHRHRRRRRSVQMSEFTSLQISGLCFGPHFSHFSRTCAQRRQKRSKAIRIAQRRSKALKSAKKRSESIKGVGFENEPCFRKFGLFYSEAKQRRSNGEHRFRECVTGKSETDTEGPKSMRRMHWERKGCLHCTVRHWNNK